uniref:Uncharacterized protein n=1 Tax=Rhizophora mucronata TaxID=61149 RepID=A0A2P2PNF9_RHIMU
MKSKNKSSTSKPASSKCRLPEITQPEHKHTPR